MIKQRLITWNDVERGINKIVSQIFSNKYYPDVIVGIPRGGAIPATMLAHRLDIKDVRFTTHPYVELGRQMLLVDEICDTGKTFKQWSKVPDLHYCTLVYNIGSQNKFNDVDYCGIEIDKDEDKRWIVFPWEV